MSIQPITLNGSIRSLVELKDWKNVHFAGVQTRQMDFGTARGSQYAFFNKLVQ